MNWEKYLRTVVKKINNKLAIIVLIIPFVVSCSGYQKVQTDYGEVKVAKNDLAQLSRFFAVNFHAYKGKEIGVLLDDINQNFIHHNFYQEPPFVARCFTTTYPNNISVEVYTKNQFILTFGDTLNRDLDRFRKEKLYGIKLHYKNKCLSWYEDW